MPSFILIHRTVWPQYTNVTDRQDRQDNGPIAWGEPFYKRSPKNGWIARDAVWDLDSGGPRKHVLGEDTHWRQLSNTIEPSMWGRDEACCQITSTTCLIVEIKITFPCYLYLTEQKLACFSWSSAVTTKDIYQIIVFCSFCPHTCSLSLLVLHHCRRKYAKSTLI